MIYNIIIKIMYIFMYAFTTISFIALIIFLLAIGD